jgi:dipeptidyl-peptidase-4
MSRLRVLAILVWLLPSPLFAQQSDQSQLTLARIFSGDGLHAKYPSPARWLDEGAAYTTLEPSATSKDQQEIVRHDAKTGTRTVLVSTNQLTPAGAKAPLTINDYHWSKDGKLLLIFTNSQRVWRQHTRGDYWVLDRVTNQLRKLGGDAKSSSLMFAKFSPDGTRAGYVREHNIYVEDLKTNKVTPLTRDGAPKVINGTFDWVYEEELFLRDGWRWSPDGRSVAYWQLDSEGVREFALINNTDSLYPTISYIPYPKAGEKNSAGRVGVVSAAGGATRWLEVSGDPRNHYIARMDWAANSDEIVLQQLNRLQNANRVMLADAHTGRVRTIMVERDGAWVDIHENGLEWLEKGNQFLWVSESDGWRHAYVVSRDGNAVRRVTHGEFDMIQVEKVDEPGGWLYFSASPENATQRYLYRVALGESGGGPERVTPADQPGMHHYNIAPNAAYAFHTWSAFGVPPRMELIRLPGHEVVRIVEDNDALRKKLAAIKHGPTEFFRLDIGDGVKLDGWVMKPPEFDPTKRYPVLFHVYGEPWGQTVLDAWGDRDYLWHLMLTQYGYLVASVDNRGTPAPRGRDWRKIVYRKLGVLTSQDQAAAVKAIGRWSYVDPKRVGVWGWSGGGSSSLNAILRYPDLYHMAMAVAPVPDERLYDTIYQERYMGLPQENAEDYKRCSAITYAGQLKGDLLVVHGTGDDNVHYQGTEALANALIAANKPFTLMPYPNRTHGIFEGENTTRHVYELLTRYLKEHLPAGPAK